MLGCAEILGGSPLAQGSCGPGQEPSGLGAYIPSHVAILATWKQRNPGRGKDELNINKYEEGLPHSRNARGKMGLYNIVPWSTCDMAFVECGLHVVE